MASSQIDVLSETSKPDFEATRARLKDVIVRTRQLKMVESDLRQIQAHVVAGHDGDLHSNGHNRLPVDGLLVLGESGADKSLALKYALANLPDIELLGGGSLPAKPPFVDTPSEGGGHNRRFSRGNCPG